MVFKNTIKLLITLFVYIWPLLIYFVLALSVTAAVTTVALLPLFHSGDALGEIFALAQRLISGGTYLTFSEEFSAFLADVSDVFSQYVGGIRLAAFVGVLLGSRILFGMAEIPLVKRIDAYMSTTASYSFAGAYISSFFKSLLMQLFKSVMLLPFDLLMLLSFYGALRLGALPGWRFAMPFLFVLIILFFLTVKNMFFGLWAPCAVCGNMSVFRGLGANVKTVFSKNFFRIFSYHLISAILTFAVFLFFGIFTLGIGLVLLIPISALYYKILNTAMLYHFKQKRFYVDNSTIVSF
ncbi:MAG: hypothetical protein FWE62_05950 [Firmicutes bacterium]|nr:hypothetical protein [Bacillota bacterium]